MTHERRRREDDGGFQSAAVDLPTVRRNFTPTRRSGKELKMTFARRFWVAAAATLALSATSVASVLFFAPGADAATPACGTSCVSVFSKELGSSGPVEDILGGVATVGQPVILAAASGSASSEDTLAHTGLVSGFFAAGMVSADANSHYGGLPAAQIEYAPDGVGTGLCVGLASTPRENEGLTLQPCTVPGVTVWIIDPLVAPTGSGYFAIINAATTDFDHPFAMSLNPDEVASHHQLLQILVRRLQFLAGDPTVPDSQLWGVLPGPFASAG
jgi:hypothetical protein